jgi:hypothetical protein
MNFELAVAFQISSLFKQEGKLLPQNWRAAEPPRQLMMICKISHEIHFSFKHSEFGKIALSGFSQINASSIGKVWRHLFKGRQPVLHLFHPL